MTEPWIFEEMVAFLRAGERREVRTGTVARVEDDAVIMDLDEAGDEPRAVGRILPGELSWRRDMDPADVVDVGRRIEAEVIGVDPRTGQVLLSARACEDPALRTFLLGLRRGDVVAGTVTAIHPFGVFVRLDAEPADIPTGMNGTGFINVAELSWSHLERVSDVVAVGQRVTVEVLRSDTRRGQAAVSLKATQEDPFAAFVDRVGEVVPGRITKIVPFGVFVRIADGVEGLLRFPDPTDLPAVPAERTVRVGEEITVSITEVDPRHRRVSLAPAR